MIFNILQKTVSSSLFGWRRPAHLILHVTSRCNARCGMCFAWQRLNKDRDLSLEEIRKITKELPNLIFLDLSGGEPFLRSDLPEVLSAFEKESPGVYVNLPTNGFLPEKIAQETEKILRRTKLPLSLNLSLDGLAKTHDRIRGVKGGFEKALQTYQLLSKIKKSHQNLSLKVATVISQQNFAEFEELSVFIQKEMREIDFHTLILVRGQPPDRRFKLPALGQIEAKRGAFFRIWDKFGYGGNLGMLGERVGNISHRFLFDLYLKTLKEKKMAMPCLAGKAHTVIYANGDVSLCELRSPIGNLIKVDFDFEKLWQGREAKEQREEIRKNTCYCAHGCNWTDNVFFNPKTYPTLMRELLKG